MNKLILLTVACFAMSVFVSSVEGQTNKFKFDAKNPATYPHPSTMPKGAFEISKDGAMTSLPVPAPGTAAALEDERVDRLIELRTENSPMNLLLARLSSDEVNMIVAVELSDEQKKKIAEVVKDYKKGAEKFQEDFYLHAAVNYRLQFSNRIYDEILLPAQRQTMGKTAFDGVGIFKVLTNKNVADFVDLTHTDIDKIKAQCKAANEKIERARTLYLESLLDSQGDLQAILNTLDENQASKVKKLIGKDTNNFFERFDLPAMDKATKLDSEKK